MRKGLWQKQHRDGTNAWKWGICWTGKIWNDRNTNVVETKDSQCPDKGVDM